MAYNPLYEDSYGIWEVKIHHVDKEDECIGIYQGHLDEIAFTFASKTTSYLILRKLKVEEIKPCVSSVEVTIQLDPNYTPYLQSHILLQDVQDMLKDWSDIVVQTSNKYASTVKLTHLKSRDALIESALSKLTDEEKKALGVVLP